MRTSTTALAGFIADPGLMDERNRALAIAGVEDTLAVALAGWNEPVAVAARRMYAGGTHQLIDESTVVSAEHGALTHAVAGHALDFDDVHLVSTTHPSVVIVPALLAAAQEFPSTRARVLSGYAVGVAVNVLLGAAMGFEHYRLGWHATSTIGALASAAAVAHMLALDAAQIRSALALAAAQAAGLQRNFGTMAKPMQAGFASAAGLRSVLLAKAGVSGDQDVLGPAGFIDMYSTGGHETQPLRLDMASISVKLYPCCYGAHRMIAGALALREAVPDVSTRSIQVRAPAGQLQPLRVTAPQNGLEAKFCARYIIATALLRGEVTLRDFTDEAVHAPERRALMQRIVVSGVPNESSDDTLDCGVVTIGADAGNRNEAVTIRAYPGSPLAPATDAQRTAKLADCLRAHDSAAGTSTSLETFRASVMQLCATTD